MRRADTCPLRTNAKQHQQHGQHDAGYVGHNSVKLFGQHIKTKRIQRGEYGNGKDRVENQRGNEAGWTALDVAFAQDRREPTRSALETVSFSHVKRSSSMSIRIFPPRAARHDTACILA